MITNERQYRISKAALHTFQQSLKAVAGRNRHDPILQQAERESIESEIDVLREQIAGYEALRAGEVRELDVAFNDLGEALVLARTAANLSQKQLAERLGIKEQQVQRYEATAYEGAKLERLKEVAWALGLNVRVHIPLSNAEHAEQPALVYSTR